jgi:hypothetical protein
MPRQQHHFPPPPEIGLPESHYAKLAQRAERVGDIFARDAAKVGQYVTLALAANLDWPSKRRYFEHALRRHCLPPPLPDEEVWLFFQKLADLVRQYAGQEALRLASAEDDHFAYLQKAGLPRSAISAKAEVFFNHLIGRDGNRPDCFTEEDWIQLKVVRAEWTRREDIPPNATAARREV